MKRALCMTLLGLGLLANGADIYLAGDSTMCNYGSKQAPQQGWGHELPALVNAGTKVVNLAVGGRSVKSFRSEGRWEKLLENVKEGDYVVIQFGHNDSNKKDQNRYARHNGEFRELLKTCIAEVREKKANPVLATVTCRWAFTDDNTKISNGTPGAYAAAARAVAEAEKVPVIDLNTIGRTKLLEAGPEETKKYYMVATGKKDNLHLTEDGAKAYAGWFVEAAKAQNLPIAELFK